MPHPPPGDLHDPGIEPVSCIAGGLFTSWATVFAFLVAKSPSQNSRKWNNLKIKSCETSASLGQIRCGVLSRIKGQYLFPLQVQISSIIQSLYGFSLIYLPFVYELEMRHL